MSGAGIIETVALIEPWIYSVLAGDATLLGLVNDGAASISGTASPTPLPTPFVSFSFDSGLDVLTGAGADRIALNALYLVKAVAATGSWDDVAPVAARVDALLHRPYQVMTVAGGSLSCSREKIVQYPEVNEGVQYRHLGGLYRIRASADD